MRRLFQHLTQAAACLAVLTACGGTSGDQQDTPQAVQRAATAHRSEKAAATDYQNAVQALYIAYFGRPADANGLSNFENALLAAGAPADVTQLPAAYSSNAAVKTLIDSFGQSAESQALYQGSTTDAFVTAVFQHVLGRAPAPSGLSYWSGAISSRTLTRGDAALAIMAGALTNNTAQGKLDAQLINNRLAAASYFTANMGLPLDLQAYSGAGAAQAARTMLSGITAGSNAGTYDDMADSTIFSLQQSLPAASGQVLAGSAADGLYFNPGLVTLSYQAGASSMVQVNASASNLSEFAGAKAIYAIVAEGIGSTPIFQTGVVGLQIMGTNSVNATLTTLSGLAPGLYQGTLQISLYSDPKYTTRFPGSPWNLQYSVHVLPADFTVGVYPGAASGTNDVAVAANQGSSFFVSPYLGNPINFINISANSGYPMTYTASVDVPWAALAQAGGPTPEFDVTFPNLATMAAGTYSAHVTVTASNGKVQVVPITLTIKPSMDGTGSAASFSSPGAMTVDTAGNVYLIDTFTSKSVSEIRMITPAGAVSTIVDDAGIITAGKTLMAQLDGYPHDSQVFPYSSIAPVGGIALDAHANIYVSPYTSAYYQLSPVAELAYNATQGGFGFSIISGPSLPANGPLVIDASGNLYYVAGQSTIIKKAPGQSAAVFAGGGLSQVDGTGTAAQFAYISGMTVDAAGNLYVVDSAAIRKVTPSAVVTTLVPNLVTYDISNQFNQVFSGPTTIAVDGSGNLYVANTGASNIFKIMPGGTVTNFAGQIGNPGYTDGPGTVAQFRWPRGIAVDSAGNVYVADTLNAVVRKITPGGVVTTLAGGGGVSPSAAIGVRASLPGRGTR